MSSPIPALADTAARLWLSVTEELGAEAALAGADGIYVEWLGNGRPMITAGARAYCRNADDQLMAVEMVMGDWLVGHVTDGAITWL